MYGGVYRPSTVHNFSNAIFSETQFHILFNMRHYGIHPTNYANIHFLLSRHDVIIYLAMSTSTIVKSTWHDNSSRHVNLHTLQSRHDVIIYLTMWTSTFTKSTWHDNLSGHVNIHILLSQHDVIIYLALSTFTFYKVDLTW